MKKVRRRKPLVLVEVENGVVFATRVFNSRVPVLVVDWDAAERMRSDGALNYWVDDIRTNILPSVEKADPKTAADLRRRLNGL